MNRKAYQKIKDKVHIALKSGKLVKESCSICGDEDTDAHHPDYSYPLLVEWLCKLHHYEIHGKSIQRKVIQNWNHETKRWDVKFV